MSPIVLLPRILLPVTAIIYIRVVEHKVRGIRNKAIIVAVKLHIITLAMVTSPNFSLTQLKGKAFNK